MARRRFFVDSVVEGVAEITGEDAHHLARVLRVEPGQQFEISDNHSLYLAEVTSVSKQLVRFRVLEQQESGCGPWPIVLVVSLIKFDRFEWVVEKATELGVAGLIPVEAGRTDLGLLAAAAKRIDRWRKIARESSQQSRRVTVPPIHEARKLKDLRMENTGPLWRLEEQNGSPLLINAMKTWNGTDQAALLVGPEGGWLDRERTSLAEGGWLPVSLGPAILRAETAAVAALSVLSQAAAAKLE